MYIIYNILITLCAIINNEFIVDPLKFMMFNMKWLVLDNFRTPVKNMGIPVQVQFKWHNMATYLVDLDEPFFRGPIIVAALTSILIVEIVFETDPVRTENWL